MTERHIQVTVKFPATSRVERILLVEEDPEYVDFRIDSFIKNAEKEMGCECENIEIKSI